MRSFTGTGVWFLYCLSYRMEPTEMTFHRWIPKLLKFKLLLAVKLQFSQGPWLQLLSLSIFKRRWDEMRFECSMGLPTRSVRTRPELSTPESVASNLLLSIITGDGLCLCWRKWTDVLPASHKEKGSGTEAAERMGSRRHCGDTSVAV